MNIIEIISAYMRFPSPYTHRILMLCHEKNIEYKLVMIDMHEKPAWFTALAPLGQVPVMRVGTMVIPDSRAISEYLDSFAAPHLLPSDPEIRVQHQVWLAYADEIAQEITQFVKQKKSLIKDLKRLDRLLSHLDKVIIGPYFFGEKISLVDFALVSHLMWLAALEEHILPFSLLKRYTRLQDWFNNMKQRPAVYETAGSNYNRNLIEVFQQKELLTQLG